MFLREEKKEGEIQEPVQVKRPATKNRGGGRTTRTSTVPRDKKRGHPNTTLKKRKKTSKKEGPKHSQITKGHHLGSKSLKKVTAGEGKGALGKGGNLKKGRKKGTPGRTTEESTASGHPAG